MAVIFHVFPETDLLIKVLEKHPYTWFTGWLLQFSPMRKKWHRKNRVGKEIYEKLMKCNNSKHYLCIVSLCTILIQWNSFSPRERPQIVFPVLGVEPKALLSYILIPFSFCFILRQGSHWVVKLPKLCSVLQHQCSRMLELQVWPSGPA